MLSVSKHVVKNDVIIYEDEWVSRKATKKLSYSLFCDVTEQREE